MGQVGAGSKIPKLTHQEISSGNVYNVRHLYFNLLYFTWRMPLSKVTYKDSFIVQNMLHSIVTSHRVKRWVLSTVQQRRHYSWFRPYISRVGTAWHSVIMCYKMRQSTGEGHFFIISNHNNDIKKRKEKQVCLLLLLLLSIHYKIFLCIYKILC